MKLITTFALTTTALAATAFSFDSTTTSRDDAPQDIVTIATQAGSFTTLLAAADAAGLVPALTGEGPLTVLAPTDEAFAALGEDTIADLLRPENKEKLARILKYHVVAGAVTSTDALKAANAPSLAGPELSFALEGGRLLVNGEAAVTANDIVASNGVIHVIDQVLLPPAERPQGRLVYGFYTDTPSADLARYLGVDRHGTLLIERVVNGSEAEAAGLAPYDLIVSIGGEPATSKRVASSKEQFGYGAAVEFEILRKGHAMTISTKIGVEH